jgi:hypothetical protein
MRSTATRTDALEIGLAAKQETDTLISSGTDKNRRTCGDSVKKDRRESKGERRQEQARVNPARTPNGGGICHHLSLEGSEPFASATPALAGDNADRHPQVR